MTPTSSNAIPKTCDCIPVQPIQPVHSRQNKIETRSMKTTFPATFSNQYQSTWHINKNKEQDEFIRQLLLDVEEKKQNTELEATVQPSVENSVLSVVQPTTDTAIKPTTDSTTDSTVVTADTTAKPGINPVVKPLVQLESVRIVKENAVQVGSSEALDESTTVKTIVDTLRKPLEIATPSIIHIKPVTPQLQPQEIPQVIDKIKSLESTPIDDMDIDTEESLKTPTTIPQLKEQSSKLINNTPPELVHIDSTIFGESLKYYQSLVAFNKTDFQEIRKDKKLKNDLFKMKMALTKAIGQIKDDEFTIRKTVMTLKQHIKDAAQLNQPVFIFTLIGKLFIKQAQAECTTHVLKATPLAKVLVQLLINNDFKDFILCRLIKKCPAILIESIDNTNNTNGIFALFVSICIEIKKLNLCWTWTAHFINKKISKDSTCLFSSTLLELAGKEMSIKYKNQFKKLLNCILLNCTEMKATPQVEQLVLMTKKIQ